ncbi:MAG: Ig-like domain-containing protein [Chloroflexota bacterium]
MKLKRTLRLAAIGIIFSLLSVVIPASPVLAVPTGSVYPTYGPVGISVTVTCNTLTQFTAPDTYNYLNVRFDTLTVVSNRAYTGTSDAVSFTVPTQPRFPYPIKVYTTKPSTGAVVDAETTIATFQLTPQVLLNMSTGYVGDQVSISGNGFSSSSTVSIYFDNDVVGTATSNADGTLVSTPFTIPAGARGSHIVRGRDSTDFSSSATFNISQKLGATPASGAVSDKITVTGTGFAASSNISLYWDDVLLSASSVTSGITGGFTLTSFTVPATSRGSHTIKATDESANSATAPFSVAQMMSMSPLTGFPGTVVTVSGSGFEENRTLSITYNSLPVVTNPASVMTDSGGSFSASFAAPAGVAGTYTVQVSDGTSSSTASFTAVVEADISQTTTAQSPGTVGMKLTLTGTGFKPNATVTIKFSSDPVEIGRATTDSSGAFSITVTIPPSAGGDHTITATDGTTIKNFPFFMEMNPPPAPEPLLPIPTGNQTAAKAKSLAQFDWGDVTDPSGFIYTLEVAPAKDFSALVIQRTGLTVSEYTLSESEKLPSNKRSTPYYWRVRAIDGASNVGGWSTPQPFSVGFSFEFKGWMLYIVIGIGGVLLFLIGFFLGSRRGYE